jgi:uncharacterized protein involved in exopolysaccharide biosynthesis
MQSLLTPGVRDALAIVRYRKYKVAIAAALSMLLATFFAASIPSSYVASSSLLVKFGREYVYRPEVGAPPAVPSVTRTNEIVNGEIQILRARDLKQHVVNVLGPEVLVPQQKGWLLAALSDLRIRFDITALETAYAWVEAGITSLESAIAAHDPAKAKPVNRADEAAFLLERDFKVQGIKDSPVIELSYAHQNPAVARRVLQELIDAFTEKRLRIYSEPQLSFLRHQIGELRGKLTNAEAALQAFKADQDIYNIDEQMRLLLVRESEFENRVKEDASKLGEIERRIAAIDQQLREVPKTVVLNAESDTRQVRNAEQMLLDMTLREQQLLVRYVDSHPVVQDLRKEMAEVRRFLEQHKRDQAGRVTTGRNDNYVKLEFERLGLGAEQQSLKSRSAITARQLEQIRQQIQKVGLHQRELRELEREISLQEQNYQLYRVKAEEERATVALDEERRTNVRVIQSPVTSALPAGVPKFVKVLMAGTLGGLIGCAIVLFLEGRRRVFYSVDAVETRLRLPVVLALPDLRGSRT